jgi:hypothetical protein
MVRSAYVPVFFAAAPVGPSAGGTSGQSERHASLRAVSLYSILTGRVLSDLRHGVGARACAYVALNGVGVGRLPAMITGSS